MTIFSLMKKPGRDPEASQSSDLPGTSKFQGKWYHQNEDAAGELSRLIFRLIITFLLSFSFDDSFYLKAMKTKLGEMI